MNDNNNQEHTLPEIIHHLKPKISLEPKHSNLFMLILVAGAIIVPFFVIIVLSIISGFVSGPELLGIPMWVISMVSLQIMLLGGSSVIYLIIKRKHIRDILPLRRLGWRNVIMIIILTIALIPILSLVNAVSQLVFPDVIGEVAESVIQEGGVLTLLITFAVFPPIFEEIAFRGIGFAGFRHVKIGTAAIINGLVFGFLHMNMNQFIYAFAAGIIFCYMMYYTKSIWAPILSHFIINAFGALMTFIQHETAILDFQDVLEVDMAAGGAETVMMLIGLGFFALIALAVFIGIYIFFKRHNLRRNEAEGIITNTAQAAHEAGMVRPRAFTWAFLTSAAIFAVMMFLTYLVPIFLSALEANI